MSFKKAFLIIFITGNISALALQRAKTDQHTKAQTEEFYEKCHINGSTAAIGGVLLSIGYLIPAVPLPCGAVKSLFMITGGAMMGGSMNTLAGANPHVELKYEQK